MYAVFPWLNHDKDWLWFHQFAFLSPFEDMRQAGQVASRPGRPYALVLVERRITPRWPAHAIPSIPGRSGYV